MSVIEVNNLTKRYGNHTAVSNLSFSIEEGQIYGFLGPNGAGKSTTMNIMTGCLAATSGEVKIGGYDIYEDGDQAKQLIGYLPEQPPLYLDRTPREYLLFVARAKGIPTRELETQISHVMKITGITDVSERLIKNLSKGYKQRVGIAQALLGDPKVIILDEPTVGLDPKQIIEIRELITSLGKKHTVILSSHILSEVQSVCQTILIISKGKLVACDTPENLEKLFAGTTTVELTAEMDETGAVDILKGIEGISIVETKQLVNGRCFVKLETDADDSVCREIFFAFARAEKAIIRMTNASASLEDIFIELTSADPTAEDASSGAADEGESEEYTEEERDEALESEEEVDAQ